MSALARLVLRHPRRIVGTWSVLLLIGGALASHLDSRVEGGGFDVGGSQSQVAAERGATRFAAGSTPQAYLSVVGLSADASAAQVRGDATRAAGVLRGVRGVAAVGAPVASADGRAVLVAVTLAGTLPRAQTYVPAVESALASARLSYAKADLVGQAAVYEHYLKQSKKSLQTSSAISFPVTLAILLAAFLSVVAAFLPVVLAAVCVGVTFGALYLLSYVIALNAFVQDAALVLGLGLSIDFALFVVTRVREEMRHEGAAIEDAITTALQTTGRAIAVSGLTIAAALSGLFITGIGLFASLAIGAVGAALIAVAAALTLMPAVLALLGLRLERMPIRRVRAARDPSPWQWLANFVVSRRVAVLAVVVPLLLALSIPLSGLRIDFATVSALPTSDPVRGASDQIAEHFGPGFGSPVVVLARTSGSALRTAVAREPGVVLVSAPEVGTRHWARVFATLAVAPDGAQARQIVRRLRSSLKAVLGPRGVVGGSTAETLDLLDRLSARTPLVVVAVLLAEILLLTLVFSAPLLAIKAAVTTLLSVGAALGAMMLLLGGSGEIQYQVPLFLFATVFGLSTDYEVFLLSRIRESHRSGLSNAESVKTGLVHTARSITLAGSAMMVVFFAFAISPLVAFQQLGLGLGLAILLDVTLVRGLLVPATMALLGELNWWRPALPGGLEEREKPVLSV